MNVEVHIRSTTSASAASLATRSRSSRLPGTARIEGICFFNILAWNSVRTKAVMSHSGCLLVMSWRVWPPMYPVAPARKTFGIVRQYLVVKDKPGQLSKSSVYFQSFLVSTGDVAKEARDQGSCGVLESTLDERVAPSLRSISAYR